MASEDGQGGSGWAELIFSSNTAAGSEAPLSPPEKGGVFFWEQARVVMACVDDFLERFALQSRMGRSSKPKLSSTPSACASLTLRFSTTDERQKS